MSSAVCPSRSSPAVRFAEYGFETREQAAAGRDDALSLLALEAPDAARELIRRRTQARADARIEPARAARREARDKRQAAVKASQDARKAEREARDMERAARRQARRMRRRHVPCAGTR